MYFIKQEGKPVREVYCDMETDGGGLTLFFSYVPDPYDDSAQNHQQVAIHPGHSHAQLYP
mgnify:CR=1 FL=1